MATVEELNDQIAETRRQADAAVRRFVQLEHEKMAALQRQRLRQELEEAKEQVCSFERMSQRTSVEIAKIDSDSNLATQDSTSKVGTTKCPKPVFVEEAVSCNYSISKGEFVWTIMGMSWLRDTLKQRWISHLEGPDTVDTESGFFEVGDSKFHFWYAPDGCSLNDRHGSLVIVHSPDDQQESVLFRYRILIKRARTDKDFVLWGAGSECIFKSYPISEQIFGPDVQLISNWDLNHPYGIFGLSHDQLLSSEWIDDDALTVKFELEVRTDADPEVLVEARTAILPSSFTQNVLALLQDGTCSDVNFIVQGQNIKAHSQILSARSEYFHKLLTGGLRESISKEVVVDDCDVETFKALLSFLYSDNFSEIEAMIPAPDAESKQDVNTANVPDPGLSLVLTMLALSHKYQIIRLQSWCEHKLSACLSVASVCMVLQQAHLFEAKQLEKECYEMIKSNLPAVMATPDYVKLFKECPELALRINLYISGLPESTTASLLETQLKTVTSGSKRKREE